MQECIPLSVVETVAADAHDAGLVRVHTAFGVEIAAELLLMQWLVQECMPLSVLETVAADAHDAGLVRVHTAFGVEIATELLRMTLGCCRSACCCLLWKPSQLMLMMLGLSGCMRGIWCGNCHRAAAHDAGLVQECMPLSVVETVAADAHDAGLARVHTAFGVEIATELLLMTLGLCRSACRCLLWETVAADAHDAGLVRVHTAFGVEIATELLLMRWACAGVHAAVCCGKPSQLMLMMLGLSGCIRHLVWKLPQSCCS